jgi:hypothetical protein
MEGRVKAIIVRSCVEFPYGTSAEQRRSAYETWRTLKKKKKEKRREK